MVPIISGQLVVVAIAAGRLPSAGGGSACWWGSEGTMHRRALPGVAW